MLHYTVTAPNLVVRASRTKGCHVWRDKEILHAVLLSDEMVKMIKSAKLKKLEFAKQEVADEL